MFGYVTANGQELTKEQKNRYSAVYCGICRQMRTRASNTARVALSYDMAFLAILLMSLYEPEESGGDHACILHPMRHYADSPYIRYAADMNIALAYHNCMDDYWDEGKLSAKYLAGVFSKDLPRIQKEYPRQWAAMESCLAELAELEKANSPDPDAAAGCFGKLLGELLVYQEDRWAEDLRQMGMGLGRYIYLADAATDYHRDKKKHRYNPFLAMGMEADPEFWEQSLLLAMGGCTACFERLPLVQDKPLLDNILYSGIWLEYRSRQRRKGRKSE